MSLATEGKYNLAVDTDVLRDAGRKYGEVAGELRELAKGLTDCLSDLVNSGWTTNAGKAFQNMVSTNWEQNIEKYADLLDTLQSILNEAVGEYEELIQEVENTKL